MNKSRQSTRAYEVIRHCAGGRADERGSAIVLVLVSVVLMAVLAATLLQVTRFERIPRPVSNIDIVVESVIDEILNQATNDLLDNQGNMFNHRFTTTNGAGDEPWDYPWTNPGPGGTVRPGAFGRTAESIDGTTVDVLGGLMDDTWLAATEPDFRGAGQFQSYPATLNTIPNGAGGNNDGVWRKITSLTGMFLGGNNGSKDLSTTGRGDKNPNEYPVTSLFTELNSDSNIRVNHPDDILVDSDGDGVGDARWEWAPIRQIGTTRYVMAVRVVDLSSRLDLNVAMGRGGTTDATALRGTSPSEMNGHTFAGEAASAAGVSSSVAQDEWRRVLNFRLTGQVPPPNRIAPNQPTSYEITNPAQAGTRRDYWRRGASRLSPIFGRNGEVSGVYDYSAGSTFGLSDAFELLQRNGLNSANTSQLEELMPNFLRDSGAEDNFNQSNATVTGRNWTQRQFWLLDPRKQLSPFTGAMAISRPAGPTPTAAKPKIDVNRAIRTTVGLEELSKTIREVLTTGGWLNLKFQRFAHLANERDAANQLAVNIKDYSDRDNIITVLDGMAGLEALPYITEVYTQRPYEAVNVQAAVPPAVQDTVTWVSDKNRGLEQGYAIEIGNPFGTKVGGTWQGRPVSLQYVYLGINRRKIDLSTLTGAPTELLPGEVLIIRRDSKGHSPDQSKDDISRLIKSGVKKIYEIDVTMDNRFDWNDNDRSTTIGLHARTITGTSGPPRTADWPYSACDVEVSPVVIPAEQVATGTVTAGMFGYVQTNYQGYGDGLRMMTMVATPKSKAGAKTGFGDNGNSQSLGKPSYNAAVGGSTQKIRPEFGVIDKKNGPPDFKSLYGADQQIAWQDNPRDRMQWIGDILQIPLIGPDPRAAGSKSATGENFNKVTLLRDMPNAQGMGIESLMLPYQQTNATAKIPLGVQAVPINGNAPTTTAGGDFGLFNVPHGILLLERLATINPAMDRADGDNDAATESVTQPDLDELLVPGKINLNTVSLQTLARALPYPDGSARLTIARAILERRESMRQLTDHSIGADNVPGLQYVTSLYEQIERLNFSANPSRDGVDNVKVNNSRIDWTDYESNIGQFAALQDGAVDDREEQIMLAKWLSEIADNRSDVFAAYIIVQGYAADDFTSGAVESRRLIIIFSRATVHQGTDQAVEIGRFTFD